MVYIVDDDQNIRDAFVLLLNSANYKCTSFDSAETFLDNYKKGSADLLILDMQLTGMNGCSLLEKMKRNKLYLPVIVITAFDEPKYRDCCKEYGVIAYLRKPVDGTALLDLIKFKLDVQFPNLNNNSLQTNGSSI